jgi:3-oxoacyl-[acyl-carrier-protein] synthase II
MQSNGKRRVVVTGMGVISPIGNDINTVWQNLMAGKSGISRNVLIPEEKLTTCTFAGQCLDFLPENFMDKKESRRMDRFTQFGVAAAQLAMDDSKLDLEAIDHNRMGVIVGSASGGIGTIEENLVTCTAKGYSKCSPFLVPMMIGDMASGRISIRYQAKGPNRSVVTACATGADSIGDAYGVIGYGKADIMIAGGAEAPITPLSVAGFASCRALSTRNDSPTTASRPFDTGRDGFVIAEGSGVIILEALEHALARGARIYGEMIGYGASSDAYDVVSPCEDGDGARRAMLAALEDANITPEAVDYINAHGTSTPLGDVAETTAIQAVFGSHAHGLHVSSTKSMHGHMLGAAGAMEAIISLLAINHKTAPPTMNLQNLDPACPQHINYVPNQPKVLDKLDVVMSNSFGFGGHNASLIFKRFVA